MPKYESERIGREIETALSIKHISQKELADKLYVTPSAVNQWIKGETTPHRQFWTQIFMITGVKITNILSSTEDYKETEMKNITPLEQIKDLVILDEAVDEIMNRCQSFVDQAFAHTITQMLRRMLYLVTAFEVYYQERKHKHSEDDGPVDWSWIGYDLKEIILSTPNSPWPMPREKHYSESLLLDQIKWMNERVYVQTLSDSEDRVHTAYAKYGTQATEEDMTRDMDPQDVYLEDVALEGFTCGQSLETILPKNEDALIVTLFKNALFGLIDVLLDC